MKKAFFIVFVLSATVSAVAQELNSYKNIIVPAEFEFLKEPNQYELNALTKFLLEKKGYEVFLEGEEGMNTTNGNRCETLSAHLRNESGFLVTRLQLVLKDCNNKEIFVSEVGDSRVKEYKGAYHEAIREAVKSIPEKEDPIEEAVVSGFPEVNEVKDEENGGGEEKIEGEVIEKTTNAGLEKNPEAAKVPGTANPDVDRLEFVKGNGRYFLTKTENGYNFYQKGMGEPFAALIGSSTGSGYIYSSITSNGMAQFNESGNLVVEILNPETNTLESTEYILQN